MTAPVTNPYLDTAPLAPGDTVRIVSPSSPAGPTEAGEGGRAHLDYAVAELEAWGLTVEVAPHAVAVDKRASYLCGSDDERRADLIDAWCAEHVSAVVCLRGGYGAMRLLDGIDFETMHAHRLRPDGRPKLLTGSSDITALHQAWAAHIGVPTLFSPMAGNAVFRNSEFVRADIRAWLMEPWGGREITGTARAMRDAKVPSAARTMVPGTARGILGGGNLSLLAASIGSQQYAPAGHLLGVAHPGILALEDVTETMPRLDNLLLQLARAGYYRTPAGIALGSWDECGDLGEIEALCHEYFAHLGVPVVWELGFGHDPDATCIPMGVEVELAAPADGAPSLSVVR